jgi:hypothetical protein
MSLLDLLDDTCPDCGRPDGSHCWYCGACYEDCDCGASDGDYSWSDGGAS